MTFQMQRLVDFEDWCRKRADRQNEADAFKEAIGEIERLQRCHRIVAKQAGFYKPELPDFTKVEIHLGVLRAAAQCIEHPPWEVLDDEQ